MNITVYDKSKYTLYSDRTVWGGAYPGLSYWAQNAITCFLKKGGRGLRQIHTGEETRGKSNVTTEADIGVTWPQAKECCKPWKAVEARNEFSPRALWGNIALLTP